MKKQLKTQAAAAIVVILLILISFSAATYAWFTNSPDVNVEPMSGSIGTSDGSLLISATQQGPFDVECTLNFDNIAAALEPVSTADLDYFFTAGAQDKNGVTTSFILSDGAKLNSTIHGRLFLQTIGKNAAVYLDRENMDFGTDIQALASMRLGLLITTKSGTVTHIFQLDDLADVSGAEVHDTVSDEYIGMVVGNNGMVASPAKNISDYTALRNGDTFSTTGTPLFTLETDDTAEVEFFLYLEGCDENCFNAVQSRDVAFQMAFFGDMIENDNP